MVEQYDNLYEEVVDLRDEKVHLELKSNVQNLYKEQLKQALSQFQNASQFQSIDLICNKNNTKKRI